MRIIALHQKIILTGALLILLLLPLALPHSAQAQTPVSFDTVQVDIWPEYDQPTVLVMYHLTLASTVKLPADVTIRLPEKVGQPHAVAMQDVAGLYNLNYTSSTQAGWLQISFTTPVQEVRIEYYDPTLQTQGSQRKYTYSWPGDYTVNNLSLQVQQPANATNMSFLPDLGSGPVEKDGLFYYNVQAGQVNAGSSFDLQISYDKSDNTLTNESSFQPAQPVQPVDGNTTGRVTINEVLPWALGGLGILLIAVGGLWYWRTGMTPASEPARARHANRRTTSPSTPSDANQDNVYCSQCGKRAGSSDLFCRSCGAKLR